MIIFLPPAIFLGFFALPFGRDQPTEIWFLAKLRFWFLPRKRLWNQSGVKELVTITVPKKVERVLTNGLSEKEVKSRLQALANTIDSRGWAIKNVNVYAQPVIGANNDRLIDLSSLPQDVPEDVSLAANDIMDPASSPVAQMVDNLVYKSAQVHHQQLVDELNTPTQASSPAAESGWFMGHIAAPATTVQTPILALPIRQPAMTPIPQAAQTIDEASLSRQLKQQASTQQSAYGHLRTMQPLGSPMQAAVSSVQTPANGHPQETMTGPSDPAILALARNDDLNVATLAREAHKVRADEDQLTDEVVVSLR